MGGEDIIELYERREALEVYAVGKIARMPLRPVARDRLRQRERVNEYHQWRRETSMRQSMPAFFDHPAITTHR